jgi:insertion element IS1 protein InsB
MLTPGDVDVIIRQADEAEVDDMWSFVGKQAEQRWLWHAIDHWSGRGVAYVFGRRKDAVFLQLKALREPFGITRYPTDDWGTTRVTSTRPSITWASGIRNRSSGSI